MFVLSNDQAIGRPTQQIVGWSGDETANKQVRQTGLNDLTNIFKPLIWGSV